jgi:hypothetical protein
MAYESKIQDLEIIKGDSSDIWFFGLPDNSVLGADWVASFAIISDFGIPPIVSRMLDKNSGTGTGDTYAAETKFVFQIRPSETALLIENEKYWVGVEIKNDTIYYRGEIAQFRMKVKPQICDLT